MCGLAGAYLSMIYTPQWIENMTGGRGWIALALVVFSTWNPIKILIGANDFWWIDHYSISYASNRSKNSCSIFNSPTLHSYNNSFSCNFS